MLFETFKIAIRSLSSNKLRTLLSMLGIIIGVGAVIAVISIASGSQAQVTNQIADMGSNIININPGRSRGFFGQLSGTAQNVFTMELGEAINEYSPAIKHVVPQNQTSGHLILAHEDFRTNIIGTTIGYQEVNNYYPSYGRFFGEYDLDNNSSVIVLGSEIVNELYQGDNPVGTNITFLNNDRRYVFTVIGVMDEKSRGMSGDFNSNAYIPISTYQAMFSSNRFIDSFVAQAVSSDKAADAVEQIRYLLNSYFDDADSFSINSQDQLLDTINQVTATMTLMLSGIAGISLLVGGIGIMNIMLVSVTERTREIGIRKALGAKRKHVLSQFVIEALTLSSIGGIIGVLIGGLAAYGVAQIGGWSLVISLPIILLAFLFSLVIGLFFGIYPALKASKLDPVIALSYE
ncbi:ABC transporter permease [Natronospora cellulosivora (SeqCode)]